MIGFFLILGMIMNAFFYAQIGIKKGNGIVYALLGASFFLFSYLFCFLIYFKINNNLSMNDYLIAFFALVGAVFCTIIRKLLIGKVDLNDTSEKDFYGRKIETTSVPNPPILNPTAIIANAAEMTEVLCPKCRSKVAHSDTNCPTCRINMDCALNNIDYKQN